MPRTSLVLYRDEDGNTSFLDWFEHIPQQAQYRCQARLKLLAEQGHELRRPAADYLRDGIYELRARSDRVHYRILYFFHGRQMVVISHGFTKQQSAVPPEEIERALRRKASFKSDPAKHTHVEAT